MFRKVLTAVLYFIASMHSVASADIISVVDATFGADSITRDTARNLDFLDVTFSFGRSFDDVSTQFTSGGDFEGFRYASEGEVIDLVNNFGFSPGAVAGSQVPGDTGNDQLSGLVNLLGITGAAASSNQSAAITSTVTGGGRRILSIRDNFSTDDIVISNFSILETSPSGNLGSFLVRDAVAVPEPSSFALFGIAATSVCLIRLKRSRRTTM